MDDTLVSIIMPTYNRADYIEETIKSIQAQTYTNWELLIQDDGSTDDTASVIESINDPRIIYTQFPRTGITGILKNDALKKARGRYIAFMDSDDLMKEDRLEKQLDVLSPHTDAIYSFTNWLDFKDINNLEPAHYKQISGIRLDSLFEEYCMATFNVSIGTVMYDKTAYKEPLSFNENSVFTDYSFIGRLAYECMGAILYEPLLYRRLHATNNTGTNWALDFKEYQNTVKSYVSEGKIAKEKVAHSLYLSYINLGEKYLKNGHRAKAIRSYLQGWIYKPFNLITFKKVIKALLLR